MAWFYLLISGMLEVVWVVGFKYSEGFTKPLPTAAAALAMIASFTLLSMAARHLPIGTAYAVWTGIGAVGTAILGILLFGEPRDLIRLGCIFLIVAGIAGLKISSGR
ncbi:MAG: quaternary ammonium compound efflux SMR transporter SugE [Candidatus Omnitrophica bacterium]|nr:quaternary ammonium compound efflux SMR transporter SugE [Candidatus Omnitrophota bacterium]